jgi:aryl-alcohol dehydrogenase-like predicted oxidoreductase
MTCKPLSNSGVSIPEVDLGTWEYRAGAEPLRQGLEAGARFIDTAESYGAETVVGQAVAGVRDRVFIATKISPESRAPGIFALTGQFFWFLGGRRPVSRHFKDPRAVTSRPGSLEGSRRQVID